MYDVLERSQCIHSSVHSIGEKIEKVFDEEVPKDITHVSLTDFVQCFQHSN